MHFMRLLPLLITEAATATKVTSSRKQTRQGESQVAESERSTLAPPKGPPRGPFFLPAKHYLVTNDMREGTDVIPWTRSPFTKPPARGNNVLPRVRPPDARVPL